LVMKMFVLFVVVSGFGIPLQHLLLCVLGCVLRLGMFDVLHFGCTACHKQIRLKGFMFGFRMFSVAGYLLRFFLYNLLFKSKMIVKLSSKVSMIFGRAYLGNLGFYNLNKSKVFLAKTIYYAKENYAIFFFRVCWRRVCWGSGCK
jgi:hypothetical protein